jgi:transcriptional regulator with XRE-family HTH domain
MHPLARRRFERGLSRPALAVAAGVSERTIFRVEHEQSDPHRATLAALAAALECRPSDLTLNDHEPAANGLVGDTADGDGHAES